MSADPRYEPDFPADAPGNGTRTMTIRTFLTIRACKNGGAFWLVSDRLDRELRETTRDLTELRDYAGWEATES